MIRRGFRHLKRPGQPIEPGGQRDEMDHLMDSCFSRRLQPQRAEASTFCRWNCGPTGPALRMSLQISLSTIQQRDGWRGPIKLHMSEDEYPKTNVDLQRWLRPTMEFAGL
jgi:hypothetical protein